MKDTTMRKPERFDENEPLLENGVLDSGAWRAAVAPEELRETLLEQTCAAVRFRARRRRMLLGGAVAAAYAAGLITAFLAFGGTPENPGTTPVLSEVAHSTPLPETPPAGPVFSRDLLNDPEQFALLLGRSSREQQAALLKAAGDTYLNEFGDVEHAVRCYRRLLSLEPPEDGVSTNLDDSWLLRSLKQARLQEEHHENASS